MKVLLWLLLGFASPALLAHSGHHHDTERKEWVFTPDYRLPGSAANRPGPRPKAPAPRIPKVSKSVSPLTLYGESATDFYTRLLEKDELPSGEFSIEMMISNHVNRPIGALAALTGNPDQNDVLLGFYDKEFFFGEADESGDRVSLQVRRAEEHHGQWTEGVKPYKKRWHHLVGTFDGKYFQLFHNGKSVGSVKATLNKLSHTKESRFEIGAYMNHEPYMQLGDAVQYLAVHSDVMSEKEIEHSYLTKSKLIEQGILFEDMFHFTAGPYLNAVQPSSINVLWESDRPATAVLEWGTRLPYQHQVVLKENGERRRTHQITGLTPDTPYFYNLTLKDASGQTIESGNLTFRSGIEQGQPLSFAVIGDTEARPFINDRVAKQVWAERPHFIVLVGDLTDGGTKNYRFEWTHEYFLGMNQLTSRIPAIAAPGNGEDDLVWYNHYHNLPGEESFYSYKIGDAEFFMLDSNMGHHDSQRPGFRKRQKAWLEKALKASTAKWKFAGHHHPTYSSDEDDYGNTYKEPSGFGDQRVRDDFVGLYEKYGVDMVFFGHLHSYERTHSIKNGKSVTEGGVVYVQTGGGGGNHEEATPTRNWFTRKVYSGYHYTLVNQFEDSVSVQVVDTEGNTRDYFVVKKTDNGRSRVISN